jgi:hypothetical protein
VGYQFFTESAVNHEPIAAARKQTATNATQEIDGLDIQSLSRTVLVRDIQFEIVVTITSPTSTVEAVSMSLSIGGF